MRKKLSKFIPIPVNDLFATSSHFIFYKRNEIEVILPFTILVYDPSVISFTIQDQFITVSGNQLQITQMEMAYMKINGHIQQLTFSLHDE